MEKHGTDKPRQTIGEGLKKGTTGSPLRVDIRQTKDGGKRSKKKNKKRKTFKGLHKNRWKKEEKRETAKAGLADYFKSPRGALKEGNQKTVWRPHPEKEGGDNFLVNGGKQDQRTRHERRWVKKRTWTAVSRAKKTEGGGQGCHRGEWEETANS